MLNLRLRLPGGETSEALTGKDEVQMDWQLQVDIHMTESIQMIVYAT
jgi:hypothetical protein